MAKRHLNKQQIRRIKANQRAKGNTSAQRETTSGEPFEGLVIAHHGQQLVVEVTGGETLRCYARSNLAPLATGDKVVGTLAKDEALGVIETHLPRRSVINRPHPHRGLKPIAANIDTVVIVFAAQPEPFPNLIDRYLVAAESAGLDAILALNKIDTLDQPANFLAPFKLYAELGYPLLQLSAHTGAGISALSQMLSTQTSIFVGQSGVGKSSLLNHILPTAEIKVGALSTAKDKGKHTTTAAQLFHTPDAGDIIDSPGIREFGLWHLEPEQIASGFIEFRAHINACKYRNCDHENSQGCALIEAVNCGQITAQRYASFLAIRNSIEANFSPTSR